MKWFSSFLWKMRWTLKQDRAIYIFSPPEWSDTSPDLKYNMLVVAREYVLPNSPSASLKPHRKVLQQQRKARGNPSVTIQNEYGPIKDRPFNEWQRIITARNIGVSVHIERRVRRHALLLIQRTGSSESEANNTILKDQELLWNLKRNSLSQKPQKLWYAADVVRAVLNEERSGVRQQNRKMSKPKRKNPSCLILYISRGN